jgi:hypothetical protein
MKGQTKSKESPAAATSDVTSVQASPLRGRREALMNWARINAAICVLLTFMAPAAHSADLPKLGERLSDAQVTAFARLALAGIEKEYPYKPADVLVGPQSVLPPRQVHPVFYGCFDWHSSVHGHWLLVRLLRLYPESSVAGESRAMLARQLTAEKLQVEADYFTPKDNLSFERMYGWAWALKLAAELHSWNDSDARVWAKNFEPLEKRLVELVRGYLPRLTYPIRTGVHPDTAFALALILDYAQVVGNRELEEQIVAYAREKYMADRNYSAAFEPSGEDFFSPSLNECDLMRRVLAKEEFANWLAEFMPGLGKSIERPGNREDASTAATLLQPAQVSDISDPKLGHLAGLNLSRAWTQRGMLSALSANDPRRAGLEKSVQAHTDAGLAFVFSGHYEGEHWLATFAVYLLTDSGL